MTEHENPVWSGEQQAARAAVADYEAALDDFLGHGAARTVDLLALQPGERVLDVACGTGAAALRAAAHVRPGGQVTGIDLSPLMIATAGEKARARGLENMSWRTGDMARLDFPDNSFDAVMCVLGLFFAQDMVAQAAELWRVVQPGGRLTVTTLGREWFAPLDSVFTAAVATIAPGTAQDYAPARTSDPAIVADILSAAGIPGVTISSETYNLPLRAPADWWRVVMGTGLRRTVLAMEAEAVARVRAHNEAWIVDNGVAAVELGFIYAVAVK
ncbi:class I SAM-dependent methyltransferase [Candidatus Promineifilum breve]|nr:methyltransferase domain-containing protein [Candidatus Promineifilum breve]